MGIKKLIMVLATLSLSATAFAEHHEEGEKKPFNIYGDFAGSMSFYDNETNGNTNHDDFNINLIEINLEKNWSKSKLHLSIGYGSTASAVNTLTTLSSNTLNVMNAYYQMNSSYGLSFMFGKFESPVGHESYNHMDNAQFTRSYGFALAPYFSTGAMVNYGQDMWKAGLYIDNGSGKDTDRADKNKTFGLVVDVDPIQNLHVDLNYVTGTEGDNATPAVGDAQISIMDISAAYMINEMFDVALNYINHGQKVSAINADNKASSIAGYVNANFGTFGLGLRYEQFSYDAGIVPYNGLNSGSALTATGADNSISAITLAARAEIDQNALVMLEYRMDSADDNGTFTDKDGVAADSMNTITAAMMYRF